MFLIRTLATIFVLSVLYLPWTSPAVSRQLPHKKPSHLADKEGCYSLYSQTVIPVGATYPKGICARYLCSGNDGHIQRHTCGIVIGPPDCRLAQDLSLPYPDCCPKVKCDYGTME